jgi:hypothetical protein
MNNQTLAPRYGIRNLLAGLAGVGVILLLATKAWAPQYTGGPSVRVNPNVSVEFKWITEVSWLGVVRVFNNPDGLGTPLVGVPATDAFGNPLIKSLQDVTVNVVTPLTANTGYFFQITATDPNLLNPDLVTAAVLHGRPDHQQRVRPARHQ